MVPFFFRARSARRKNKKGDHDMGTGRTQRELQGYACCKLNMSGHRFARAGPHLQLLDGVRPCCHDQAAAAAGSPAALSPSGVDG